MATIGGRTVKSSSRGGPSKKTRTFQPVSTTRTSKGVSTTVVHKPEEAARVRAAELGRGFDINNQQQREARQLQRATDKDVPFSQLAPLSPEGVASLKPEEQKLLPQNQKQEVERVPLSPDLLPQKEFTGKVQVGGTTLDFFPFGSENKGLSATGAKLALTGAALSAGTYLLSTAGSSLPGVASSATGKIVSRFGTAAQTAARTNTVTAAKSTSYLSKALSFAKAPLVALGILGPALGTYPWAEWADAEAIDSLVFTLDAADKANDEELYSEVELLLDDILDKNFWESVPVSNVILASINKKRAAVLQIKANRGKQQKLREESEERRQRDEAFALRNQ